MSARVVLIALTALASLDAAAATREGSTIVGDGDAAIGLFLDPWREEAASDLDWPPLYELPPLDPLDEDAARSAAQLHAQRDAVRQSRLQSQ